MEKLDRTKLWGLEAYAVERRDFRRKVIAHKRHRQVRLNAHAALYFEDFLTMKYQVQEMLRVERIFEPAEIEAEIEAYNPLIPDGSNWKATFMIEYPDVEQRRQALQQLKDVEQRVWAQVGEGERIVAIANEDLDRSNEDKTAAVHFLRFELSAEQVKALSQAAPLRFGISHPAMACETEVEGPIRSALLSDLDSPAPG